MSAYTAKHLQHYQHPSPPPYYAKIYPTFHLPTVCQLKTTSDHTKPTSVHPFNTYPHYANICPNRQHLLTLCQNLRTLTHTMPTSRASLLTLCQYLRTISTYAHTMPACCQRLPTLLDVPQHCCNPNLESPIIT